MLISAIPTHDSHDGTVPNTKNPSATAATISKYVNGARVEAGVCANAQTIRS